MSIIPPFLKPNDKVAVIATAKKVNKQATQAGIKILESWGLNVWEGSHLYNEHYEFAGTDPERLQDITQALNDPDIKAIFCARGGYGTGRIIDQVDFRHFIENPKWIVGFSDVTVLLSHLQQFGIASIHGPMPQLFYEKTSPKALIILKELLFGKLPSYEIKTSPYNKTGTGQGEVTGGNLAIINSLAATNSEINTDNKIMFIEEIDEYLYQVDRMMVSLKRSGKLRNLKGLIVGHMTDIKDNESPFGKNFYEIVLDAVKEYKYPVMFDFPAGHEFHNLPLIIGGELTLNVTKEKSTVIFVQREI